MAKQKLRPKPLPGKRTRKNNPASARRLHRLKRIREAVAWRSQGNSYFEIGDAMKVHYTTARRYVFAAMDMLNGEIAEDAQTCKTIDLARLDQLLASFFPDAIDANQAPINREAAANMVLKILAQRAKLTGIEAPQKTETKVDGEVTHKGLPPIVISPTDAAL